MLNEEDIPLSYKNKLSEILNSGLDVPKCDTCEFLINKLCYLKPPVPFPVKTTDSLNPNALNIISVRPSIARPETEFCSEWLPKESNTNLEG